MKLTNLKSAFVSLLTLAAAFAGFTALADNEARYSTVAGGGKNAATHNPEGERFCQLRSDLI